MIPFINLTVDSKILREEINSAIQKVLDSCWFILGKEPESFEHNFSKYIGTRFCVGVASGTEATALALMALNISTGDEVISTNLTAFPTITGILQSGAKPVVVDICSSSGLINYQKIQAKIKEKTKAIVSVHLYGQSCILTEIASIAKNTNYMLLRIVHNFFQNLPFLLNPY